MELFFLLGRGALDLVVVNTLQHTPENSSIYMQYYVNRSLGKVGVLESTIHEDEMVWSVFALSLLLPQWTARII